MCLTGPTLTRKVSDMNRLDRRRGIAPNGLCTTARVNGVKLFDRVLQAQLPTSSVGLVTHWTKARFDDVSLSRASKMTEAATGQSSIRPAAIHYPFSQQQIECVT